MARNESAVEVAVRVRPLIDTEIQRGCKEVLEVIDDIQQVRIKDTERAYTYNYVFSPSISQQTVYTQAVEKKVQELFGGYNVTILAYGQTGSGKTHSMGTTYNGTGEMGIIPRCIYEIYNICNDNFSYDFNITVSFMELYQELLYDLLAEKPRDQCIVDIREDSKGIIIPGLTEIEVTSACDALKFLIKGSQGRATSSTNMNAQSSRSHAIFTVNICMQHKQQSNLNKTAKFHLVDLAGSERPKKTGATGQTFREGVNINKGLLVLGNVISALGDEKQQHSHIPYRDSNLTRLLKDSLGGNSITLMIACVSPADYNVDETLSTLRYADRARKIKNKPVVNQDPKSAEINRLNKLVQQLRLELVGQGGPIICQAELDLLKQQNEILKSKTVDLTTKLSSTLNEKTALVEKVLFMQAANEKLTEKLQELKDQYNVTLNNLNVSCDRNDVTAIKDNIAKLQDIQQQFTDINKEQRDNEQQLRITEVNSFTNIRNNTTYDVDTEKEINDKQECHTAQQVALNAELQDLMKQLALKEHLAEQIATNANYMIDHNAIVEHETKIALLEKEKEELLNQLRNATTIGGPPNKLAEQRRKQVQELESRIAELRKKVQEQARLIKLKEKDELKIKQLNNEIFQMKQTRVKLVKAMKQESEQFRSWKLQKEREMHKLKEQDRKRLNQIVRMETMHNRQQNVLKRKVEEVAAVNKRLKEALAVRKAAQEVRRTGKVEKTNWIQQELDVYINILDAQATLQGLLEDRANLNQQLTQLKSDPELAETPQIHQLEENIELCCIQIADLQQKILDFDEENRAKTRFDAIQSVSEAKHALKTLFDSIGEKKISNATQILQLQNENSELKAEMQRLESQMKTDKVRYQDELAKQAKEQEEKIGLLLHQLRGIECKSDDEDLRTRCEIQQDMIDRLENEVQELNKKLSLMDDLAREVQTPSIIVNHISKSRTQNNCDNSEDVEMELDKHPQTPIRGVNDSVEIDDIEKDPDWKRTPLARRVRSMRSTTADIDDIKPIKRTSEGGCTCKKNCSTRTCGCKKNGRSCGVSCKCSAENCANRDSTDKRNETESTETSQDSTDVKDTTFIQPSTFRNAKRMKKFFE